MDDSETEEGDRFGVWEAVEAGSEAEGDERGLVAFSQLIKRAASKHPANNAGNLSGSVFLTGTSGGEAWGTIPQELQSLRQKIMAEYDGCAPCCARQSVAVDAAE